MSVDAQQEQKRSSEAEPQEQPAPRPSLLTRFRTGLSEIEWKRTTLLALVMAAGWSILFLSFNILQVLAGIVPVTAGLYLGRRVKTQLALHGLMLGLIGFVAGSLIVAAYGALGEANVIPFPQTTDPDTGEVIVLGRAELLAFYLSFALISIVPFPVFGAVMSGRAEQRNQETRRMVEERGGRLEKPTAVRTVEDLRGLSLPQMGTYVRNLYQKKGFQFHDYRFLDKDKHLDLEMVYDNEMYLLRLSVADKVRPGTIETLAQDMRRRDITKGVVITSTEFAPEALKSGKGRRNIVLIDGQTLFDIVEG